VGQFAGRHAARALREQEPEDAEPAFLSKRPEDLGGIQNFHVSGIPECVTEGQVTSSYCVAAQTGVPSAALICFQVASTSLATLEGIGT
jgi:hypothetical protein